MRRVVLALAAPAAGLLVSAAACSTPYGFADDGPDASLSDAVSDPLAPPSDVHAPADGRDAAALPIFCQAIDATFCDDFEQPPLMLGWTASQVTGGALSLSDSGAPSSPLHALLATTDQAGSDDGGGQQAFLVRNFDGAARKSLRVQADISLRSPSASGNAVGVIAVQMSMPSGPVLMALRFAELEGSLLITPPPPASPIAVRFATRATGPWSNVRLDVDLTMGLVSVTVDGVMAVAANSGIIGIGSSLVLAAGLLAGSPAAQQVMVDNVVVDLL